MQMRLGKWTGAAALVLSACAAFTPVQMAQKMIGQPESAVRETFGTPTETYALADGTHRWIYSKQPMGHEVYAADFDAGGRLTRFRQMLTEKEIFEARPGTWTKRDVLERFGTPREPTQYYPLMRREAWSYRMLTNGYQQAHFSAYFDDNGVLDRTMIIVDPLGGDHDARSK
ncbi:membrane protein [Ralstonia mannitolilytica]|uniref:membrane protein n=1 Tax=Ralstonia mannitolilytica TaxID=105219 RepID=UPI0005D8DDA9|nr:membrane protein [Ralstonia mannitolilytica]AJW46553.1 membrane protein [Ralstonia mannitolilytica]QIF09915.1 hypothetical protein G5A69_20640 [Ralstonia mannitolilytica]CAJ0730312.1 hypothetical protein R76706_02330 [Ralstonia mannitolilytica]CAJ0779380.1 hypothetical protein R77555_00556 [Ralstonia mannitolilytica]